MVSNHQVALIGTDFNSGHPKEKEKVLSMQKLYLKTKKQFDAHHKYLAIQRQKLKSEERQLKEATALEQKKILDDSRGRILGKSEYARETNGMSAIE